MSRSLIFVGKNDGCYLMLRLFGKLRFACLMCDLVGAPVPGADHLGGEEVRAEDLKN